MSEDLSNNTSPQNNQPDQDSPASKKLSDRILDKDEGDTQDPANLEQKASENVEKMKNAGQEETQIPDNQQPSERILDKEDTQEEGAVSPS